MQSARVVAEAVVAAANAGDWAAVASYLDPEVVEAFRSEQVEHHRALENWTPPDGIPWADFDPEDVWLRRMYEVESVDELEALPAAVLAERFMRMKHGGGRTKEGSERPRTIVGEVEDGDYVHVVFRRPPVAPDSLREHPRADVLTLRRTADGWKVLPNGGLIFDSSGGYSLGIAGDGEDEEPEPPEAA